MERKQPMAPREKDMFEDLLDFEGSLSIKQAAGFYLCSIAVLIILFGMIWSFMDVTGLLGKTPDLRAYQVRGTGWLLGFFESLGLCAFVVHKKRLVNTFGILMVFMTGVLSFFSGILSLIVPAYVMTLKSGYDTVPFKNWFR